MFGVVRILDLFCRSVAIAVNLFLAPVLSVSSIVSVHRCHKCLDFRISAFVF